MTNPHSRLLSIAFCIIGISPFAFGNQGAPQLLSVDDAVRIGLFQNPQVAGGRAGVASALANYRSTAALPPITIGGTHVQGTSTAPTLTGTSTDNFLDFSETLDTSGQRRYQAAGLNATYRSTRFQFLETLLTLEQQIRDAYWSLAAASAQNSIADESYLEAKRVYDLTVKQQEAGASPQGDVVRSSIDVANARQAVITAQSSERTALVTFNNLLGRAPFTPESLSANLTDEKSTTTSISVASVEDLDRSAIEKRPLLKSADAQVSAAKYAVQQAQAGQFPDLSINYQKSLDQNSVDSLLLNLSLPLFDFGSIRQSIRAANESKKQLEAQRLQTVQQVFQQVAQAHSDLQAAVEAADGYRREILEPSIKLLAMSKLGYEQGATGILPVIDAESTIRNARVGYINSLLAVYKAQDELMAAIGGNVDSSATSSISTAKVSH